MPRPDGPRLQTLLRKNRDAVRARLAAAAAEVGRRPEEVRLIAVTKSVSPEVALDLAALGQEDLGESRLAGLEEKARAFAARGVAARWHFVGHLQRNKARRAADRFDVIQSVDSREIARRLSDLGVERGRPVRALVEVRTADDPEKTGLSADVAEPMLAEMIALPGLVVEGLMTMAPLTDDERLIRASFAQLARLRDRTGLRELSMGMSGDYEIAIEEGATIIRVGSAIFG